MKKDIFTSTEPTTAIRIMYQNQSLWTACFTLILLLSSCVSVQVDRGPFPINPDITKQQEKENYLAEIEKTKIRKEAPNIVIILADDLGKHDISLYDPDGVHVKNIESLALKGITYDNAFTSSPVCSPSRAALFTGRYQQRYGFERQPQNRYARNRFEYYIFDHFINTEPMRLMPEMAKVPKEQIARQGIPEDEILIPEVLQRAGYATGICGKWHLGNAPEFRPNQRGFQFQYGFYEAFSLYAPIGSEGIVEHRHDYFANKHIWKQERSGSCAIRLNDSIISEEEYLTFAIARQSVEYIEEHAEKPFFLVSAFSAPHTPFQAPQSYYDQFENEPDHNKRVYYAMIAALDDAVGMIMESLEKNGLLENTIIFFSSDNGGATYTGATDNGPLRAGKFSQFEGGINIPLVIRYDGLGKSGIREKRQVSLMDMVPTVLSAAGLNEPGSRIDGTDLFRPDPGAFHEHLFWRTDYNKAVRTQQWKLIWNERDGDLFLYDLTENNYETINVAEKFPEIIKNLQEQYRIWESGMSPPLWPGIMEFRFDIDGKDTWWAI